MKSDKSTFYAILLWGLVIYAIALLTYCTMRGYVADNKDFISDFGSIIGGIGTFFAAFIAAYLFNDWRTEKSYDLHKEYLQDFNHNLYKIHSISATSNWWFVHFYNQYNQVDEEGDLQPSISIRKISVHDYSEVQKITSSINNSLGFFELYDSYSNLIEIYNKYIHIFSQLCFVNEEIEKIYNDSLMKGSSQQSVFLTFYAEDHQLNDTQRSAVQRIIAKLKTKIDINQAEPVTYESASEMLNNHYNALKSIIVNKLDLPVKTNQ